MIKEPRHLYQTFIEMNEASFEGRLYTVAYHALSAALYCALAAQDEISLRQVERLASKQLEALTEHFNALGVRSEPLEITLYTSLLRIANPRQHLAGVHPLRESDALLFAGRGCTQDDVLPLESDGSGPASNDGHSLS